jgi:putative nucleotidyltransferase with HDIG domain
MRVPGTYAHSLMVGNLAHAAAEAIGADALLVRVAAYYHDLGKMNRPEFFIENQSGCENVHDRITPSLSALVLASHVKEGIEMGQAVGLPPWVLEVIQQHHGTQLMKFFYHRATGGAGDPSLEPQFRYAGPKPQTREAAILMLADGVEAASRSLEKPTPQRIAEFVQRMVDDKLADGQLDECDLTLRDLRTIQDVFTRTLSGTLHARIAYPGDKKEAPRADEPPAPAAPVLTLATFPEEALSGALRVTPPQGDDSPALQSFKELTGGPAHTPKGNGTDRPGGPNAGGKGTGGASLAFTRGGRRGKAPDAGR